VHRLPAVGWEDSQRLVDHALVAAGYGRASRYSDDEYGGGAGASSGEGSGGEHCGSGLANLCRLTGRQRAAAMEQLLHIKLKALGHFLLR
jgi:hypothetical protein